MGKVFFLGLLVSACGVAFFWGAVTAFFYVFILFTLLLFIGYEFRFKATMTVIRSIKNGRLDETWVVPQPSLLSEKKFIKLPDDFNVFYASATKPELNIFQNEIAAIEKMDRAETIGYILELRRSKIEEQKLVGLITASGAYHGTEIPLKYLDYNNFATETYLSVFLGGGWVDINEYVQKCKNWEDKISTYYDHENMATKRGFSNKEWVYSLKNVCDRAGRYISGNDNPSARPVPFPQFAWEMRNEDNCIFRGFADPEEITIEDYKTTMTIVFLEALGYVPVSYLSFSPPARLAANAILARHESKNSSTTS